MSALTLPFLRTRWTSIAVCRFPGRSLRPSRSRATSPRRTKSPDRQQLAAAATRAFLVRPTVALGYAALVRVPVRGFPGAAAAGRMRAPIERALSRAGGVLDGLQRRHH